MKRSIFLIRHDKENQSSGRGKRFVRTKQIFSQDKMVTFITKKDPEHWNTRGLTTKLRSKIGVLARFPE